MSPFQRHLALTFLIASLGPTSLMGQSPSPVLTWHGEIRPRIESREPVGGEWLHFTSMRTRIGLDARLEGGFRFFLQAQDVRVWGEELTVRDRSADAVDFHQAFLEVEDLPWVGGTVRAGRQEVAVGESRLIGAPDWGQAGQTFDGVRWTRPVEDNMVELVYLQIRDDALLVHEASEAFGAATFSAPLGTAGTIQAYAIHLRDTESTPTRETSLGGIWRKETDRYTARLQGIFQTGERAGQEVKAYLLAAAAGLLVLEGKGSLTLWYDRLSGDGNPDDETVKVFSTQFGARNRYYGRADFFLDIPSRTQGLGLQDGAVKMAYAPTGDLTLNLDLHSFRTASRGDLSTRRLGEEADAWARYRFRRYLTIQAGYSLTWAASGMEELGILDGTGNFGYVMTSLKF